MVAGTLGALGPLGALTTLTTLTTVTTLTGCSGDAGGEDAAQATAADKRLRRDATRQSLDLLAHYDATADAHSGLAERLRPLRAATLRHAEVLSGEDRKNGEGGKGRDGRGQNREHDGDGRGDDGLGGGRHGRHGSPKVPGEEKAALTALGDAERRTAQARTAALVKAPPETARLLASLAAAGAAHAYLLGAGDGEGDGGEDDGA